MLTMMMAMALTVVPQGPGSKGPEFEDPVRIRGGKDYVRTEAPGYAAPCLHDVDGDGHADLVVGQFAGGKMRLYPGQAGGSFGAGRWIQAEGEVAVVPGVW